ncbi:MAG: hypothetical protein SPG07_09150 [Coriobacteriales bacterium]|nr:hypothetical protein [Coriobacteriales bacterium]
MPTKVRIKHISKGWHDILCSAPVAELVDEAGNRIADAAGDGFEYSGALLGDYGGGRVIGFVVAKTKEARVAEATAKSLTMAVG